MLSVDLGTSTTVAAFAAPDHPPRVIEIDGASAMPSGVFAAEDGRLVVGREALRLARTAPDRFEPHPLSRVGEPNLLLGEATTPTATPVAVPVAAALAAVLGTVLTEAGRQLGGAPPDQVRLTHPARWDTARCAVLLEAARLAGVSGTIQLVAAPAAVVAHVAPGTGQPLAVVDLGAGRVEIAVAGPGPVLAEPGPPGLGGLEIDQALLDHLGRQVGDRDQPAWERLVTPGSSEDRRAALAVRDEVRAAKEALSEHPSTVVALPEPFGPVPVTRAELETLLQPEVARVVELLGSVTGAAGVCLVGGSSRIPLVAATIAERLRVTPVVPSQPETAAALGACAGPAPVQPPRGAPVPPAPGSLPPAPPVPPGPLPYAAPGPARPGARRAALIGAAAVALVAAIVAVVVLAPWRSTTASPSPSGGDEPAGPNGQNGYHWSMTMDQVGVFEGMWAAPDSVVLGHWQGFIAFDAATGEQLWSFDLPDNNFLCNMTPTVTPAGVGAFAYGEMGEEGGENCHHLQTISVETGEAQWSEPVSLVDEDYTGWLGKIGGTSLSINGDLVTAAYGASNSQDEHPTDLTWVDTRTGERLGTTESGAEPLLHLCRLTGHAQVQRDTILALSQCDHVATPRILSWSIDHPTWELGAELDGCPELSNTIDNVFMRQTGKDELVIGCYTGLSLQRLYAVTDSFDTGAVSLDGVAMEGTGTGGGAARPPENLVLDGKNLYLPRGEDSTSNGVIAERDDRRQWQYALRDTTEVKLMAAESEEVAVLVVTPGPSTLYTVAGANEMTEAPELDPRVAEELPDAEQSVRVGDYLICGFGSLNGDGTVIGAVALTD
ncbi:hypothetical protein BLA60_39035 [Actinophytocola xinjiangensis]|uniref:Uncharacterized protein n=1 Tax=Actinophytocola xinjiangensis TaxID=485602 RepID=A0A7Z0WDH6_9PSEU|nr:hypothetical protein BLA60_39035 [Actinophytocola xinjiangensis]